MRAGCALPLMLVALTVSCNDSRVPADADAGAATDAVVGSDAFDGDATYELFQPGAGEQMSCGDEWCSLTFIDGCGTYGRLYDSLSDLLVIGSDWRFPSDATCEGVGFPYAVTDLTAACLEGTCTGVDLRATSWRSCSTDDECVTTSNSCCPCLVVRDTLTTFVGIHRDHLSEFRALVCSPMDETACSCYDSVRESIAFRDEFYPARCWHGVCRSEDELVRPERYGIPTEP